MSPDIVEQLRHLDAMVFEVERLEALILQLDSTLADVETAKRKGYWDRDRRYLKDEADAIRNRERIPAG